MGLQQEILNRIGETLSNRFKDSIAPVKATGRTAASIHQVATTDYVEVLAAKNIGAIEYGRRPTSSGAPRGNPPLIEMIKEWALAKGIISDINDRKQLGIVYAITRKIHKEGWKPKLNEPLTNVIKNINEDELFAPLIEYQIGQYESNIIKALQ